MYKVFLCSAVLFLFSVKGFSQCNNVNLADGRPQSACFGSVTTNLMEPWRAFDVGGESAQTRWAAPDGGQTHYVGIDLGQAYNICSVYLQWGSLDYATSFKIQGSNDMSSWTDLISVTANTQSAITVDNLPTTGTYRYIRALFLARVYDWSYYNLYSFEIYNRVANDPPNVTITAPSNGASYIHGTSIQFTSTASDVNGTVSKVEYYQGTTKLGEATTAPYTYIWTDAALGDYDIEAKAIDNGGAFTWTDPLHITVTNPPASMRNWILSGSNLNNSNTGFVSIGGAPVNMPADTAIKLSVKGTIYAKKLTVTESLWSDYVFEPNYRLRPLHEVEDFIFLNHHLPGVPSAKEVKKDGINLGDNQAVLLKKIEELTLYVINLNKKIEKQRKEIKYIKRRQKKTAVHAINKNG